MRITTPLSGLFQKPPDAIPKQPSAGLFGGLLQRSDPAVSPPGSATASPLNASGVAAKASVLRQTLNQHLQTFQQRLQEALSKANIDTEGKIRLESDSFGRIQASGHTQNADIEAVFENNPELRSLFHIVAASVSYLQGHQHAPDDLQLTLEKGELQYRFR